MKTITQEAIQAFTDRHYDRHLGEMNECGCDALIVRAKEYEAGAEQIVRAEIGAKLEKLRDEWLDDFSNEKGPVAIWIAVVFEAALKFCNGGKK